MEYAWLKLVHLGALILWLGPALGAWWVLKAVENLDIAHHPVIARVNKVFFWTIVIEHLAFIILLVSGFALALKFGFLDTVWLQQKLHIVLLVIVPLEVVDIFLGNWLAAQASSKSYQGVRLSNMERRWLAIYHGPFTKLALMIIPLSVLLVMYLAVSKAPLI